MSSVAPITEKQKIQQLSNSAYWSQYYSMFADRDGFENFLGLEAALINKVDEWYSKTELYQLMTVPTLPKGHTVNAVYERFRDEIKAILATEAKLLKLKSYNDLLNHYDKVTVLRFASKRERTQFYALRLAARYVLQLDASRRVETSRLKFF